MKHELIKALNLADAHRAGGCSCSDPHGIEADA
jgi:hypothetical protein